MSGWIKFEKDLRDDPRVRRMAKALDRQFAFVERQGETRNVCALPGVTLVCGALIQLWSYADSHAREDDSVDISSAELDELVGIPGFALIMPPDWLQIVDETSVILPGYQKHNGVEAKKRALTQKRVAQHREHLKRESVTPRNASALPDQTRPRPDQTETIHRAREPAADPSEQMHQDADESKHLESLKSAYPPHAARSDWLGAFRKARQLVDEAESTWPELLAGVERYAAHCAATGRLVMNPAKFFTDPDRPWSQAWPIPPPKPSRSAADRLTWVPTE